MSTTQQLRSVSRVFYRLCALALFLSYLGPASAADAELEAVRAKVEGVYSLEEWHTESGVFRPPQLEGRSVLLNGTIVVILHNRMQESPRTTIASYGIYVLDAKEFSYRYVEPSVFTQTRSDIAVSHKPPWEGMRSFTVSREGDTVRLRSKGGQQEFLSTPEGVTYSDGQSGGTFVGKRVYRRILSE
jgi:hypothetical protein